MVACGYNKEEKRSEGKKERGETTVAWEADKCENEPMEGMDERGYKEFMIGLQ
jgi:hypothetical protein